MTNGDFLRSATDEQLAAFLASERYRIAKPVFDYIGYGIEPQALYAIQLAWVKQEMEDEENSD